MKDRTRGNVTFGLALLCIAGFWAAIFAYNLRKLNNEAHVGMPIQVDAASAGSR